MATQSPYGGFADLSRYQAAAAQPSANPLESLIQGFQQGTALGQLPQTLQDQRQAQFEQQLARQLKNELMQQKLNDLQNPQAALAREVQKALALKSADATSGIVSMPTGLEGESIGQPGALSSEQQASLIAGGPAPSVAAVGAPIAPIAIGGTPTGFGQDISGATAATRALSDAKSTALEQAILGNLSREKIAASTATSREKIAATKAISGSKPITETSKANILGRAGKSGLIVSDVDLDKFRNESGDIDYGKLALASGRAERGILDDARDAKLGAAPAEVKSKVASYQAVQKDLERLMEKLDEESRTGNIPSGFQDIISGSLSESPTNFFTRTFQRFVLQPSQSKTAAENERLRGAVSASIGRAIAGAALTSTEKQNLIPFTPQAGDSFERLLEKASALEQFLDNQIEGLSTPIPSGRSIPASQPEPSSKSSTLPKIIKITPRSK